MDGERVEVEEGEEKPEGKLVKLKIEKAKQQGREKESQQEEKQIE